MIDRLHLEAYTRAQTRNVQRLTLEEHDLARYPFQPRINACTDAIIDLENYRPIQDRLPELQRDKVSVQLGVFSYAKRNLLTME